MVPKISLFYIKCSCTDVAGYPFPPHSVVVVVVVVVSF